MAWVYSSRLRCYTGESGVAKPTTSIDRDTLAYEYDTGDVYIYDSATWRLKETSSALPTGAATSAKQDTLIAKDYATQTTLASLLAKVIASPATEAKQDTLIAKDYATQTTLAALLAKVIAAPSTEAKQDTLVTLLTAIKDTAGIKKITDPLPVGTNLLGKTGIDQTSDGTTNRVVAKISQAAGENVVKDADIGTPRTGGTLDPGAAGIIGWLSQIEDNVGDVYAVLSTKDFATQTTLAAILAKIIASPATEAKQDTLIAKDFATQSTLNAVRDELINIKSAAGIKKITDPVSTELPDAAALADGTVNPITPTIGSNEQLYNGATWDRKRSNVQGVILASAARITTQTGADQTNYNGRNAHIILNVTALADSPSIVLKIEGKSASGVYYTLLEGDAVTGEDTVVYVIDFLPRTWRVVVTHTDADSITYSVDYAINC